MDTADLQARWDTAWGDCRPVSYDLRNCLPDRWVRFHSLPGSQRYASNDDEYAELMRRHQTVLAELLEHDPLAVRGLGAQRRRCNAICPGFVITPLTAELSAEPVRIAALAAGR